jgi:hypothetical protein
MKRCPTCKRTFDDDSLSYCLDDGTPLTPDSIRRPDSEETIVTPPPGEPGARRELPPTQYGQLPGKPTVSASQFQVPTMPTYSPTPQRRRVWPWVLAGIAVLLFFIIIIAMVIAIPKIVGTQRNSRVVIPADTPSGTPSDLSTPTPDESASQSEAPTDENLVLSQLTDIEKQWTEANVTGDKNALERILAEEYSGGDPPHNKQDYLDTLKPDPTIKSWELQDLRVDLDCDRATLDGYLRQETTGGPEVYGFTDTFVWRDGRWQAVGSRASRVK